MEATHRLSIPVGYPCNYSSAMHLTDPRICCSLSSLLSSEYLVARIQDFTLRPRVKDFPRNGGHRIFLGLLESPMA